MSIRNIPPATPAAVWANTVANTVNGNIPGSSGKNLVNQHPHGVQVSIPSHTNIQKISLGLPSKWDKDEFYPVGASAWIDSTNYITPSVSSSMLMGKWICVQMVPSNKYAGGYSTYGEQYVRPSASYVYYPNWPQATGSFQYWILEGMYPQIIPVCTGSAATDTKNVWIAATAVSGSPLI